MLPSPELALLSSSQLTWQPSRAHGEISAPALQYICLQTLGKLLQSDKSSQRTLTLAWLQMQSGLALKALQTHSKRLLKLTSKCRAPNKIRWGRVLLKKSRYFFTLWKLGSKSTFWELRSDINILTVTNKILRNHKNTSILNRYFRGRKVQSLQEFQWTKDYLYRSSLGRFFTNHDVEKMVQKTPVRLLTSY